MLLFITVPFYSKNGCVDIMNEKMIKLSSLPHTWLLDFDGTLVVHNGYKSGRDEFLPGALEFLRSLPKCDMIIILTARKENARQMTESFLRKYGVRYDKIVFGVPFGERILINDTKPSGLVCAYSVTPERNQGVGSRLYTIDEFI